MTQPTPDALSHLSAITRAGTPESAEELNRLLDALRAVSPDATVKSEGSEFVCILEAPNSGAKIEMTAGTPEDAVHGAATMLLGWV